MVFLLLERNYKYMQFCNRYIFADILHNKEVHCPQMLAIHMKYCSYPGLRCSPEHRQALETRCRFSALSGGLVEVL